MVFTITKHVDITCEVKESVWKQLFISLLASLPYFTHGVEAIELSSSAHSGHFIAADDVPWSTTTLVLATAVSGPVYCYLIDKYGRRCGIYGVSLMQAASCIPLFLPPDEINFIILHVLAGISSAGLFTVLPIYIREISNDRIRGFTVSLMILMTSAGYLMKLVIGDEEMMFLMVALVAVQFISMLVIYESPSYLVMMGKNQAAKRSISKLKCIPEDSVKVTKELTNLQQERYRARENGELTVIRILKTEIYRDATKIGVVLHTTIMLCGSIIFLDQEKTLAQLKMNLDPDKTLIVGCMFAGSLFSFAVIRFMDRKYILLIGFATMVLSMGVLAVYTQADLTVATLRWVPLAALGVLVCAYGVSWGLPTLIMVEIYNFEIRAKMLGVLYTYSQIIKLVHVHTYKYIEEFVGIYTLFYIFACINLYGVVYTIFAIPKIRNKTVKQIEKQLKRIPLLQFNNK